MRCYYCWHTAYVGVETDIRFPTDIFRQNRFATRAYDTFYCCMISILEGFWGGSASSLECNSTALFISSSAKTVCVLHTRVAVRSFPGWRYGLVAGASIAFVCTTSRVWPLLVDTMDSLQAVFRLPIGIVGTSFPKKAYVSAVIL